MSAACLKYCSLVNALGASTDEVLAAYQRGQSNGMGMTEDYLPNESTMLGRVFRPLPVVPEYLSKFKTRNNRLLLAALAPIEEKIKNEIQRLGVDRVAVVLGTSTSGILEGEQAYSALQSNGEFPAEYYYSQQEIGNGSEFLKAYLGLDGIAYTVSTACSSSAKSFASAKQLLEIGLADAVIVGGADALCKLTVNGFNALGASSASSCLPFSVNREGINIGEAAGLFLLTRDSGGIQLKGVGSSADAHHISAPEPEGRGAKEAMQAALAQATLVADDIFYLNLHGTATPHNDIMEAKAFNAIFSEVTHASSTKPLTGHTLGAAGATEVGICWALLSQSETSNIFLQPQITDEYLDEQASPIGLLSQAVLVPRSGNVYMQSNSFAFGGSNCSVVIGREAVS